MALWAWGCGMEAEAPQAHSALKLTVGVGSCGTPDPLSQGSVAPSRFRGAGHWWENSEARTHAHLCWAVQGGDGLPSCWPPQSPVSEALRFSGALKVTFVSFRRDLLVNEASRVPLGHLGSR